MIDFKSISCVYNIASCKEHFRMFNRNEKKNDFLENRRIHCIVHGIIIIYLRENDLHAYIGIK